MTQRDSNNQPKSVFLLLITGEIEYAELPTADNLYCKYFYVYGNDWRQLSGLEEGISLTCQKGRNSNKIVLNTPLEATFSSTNPFRWPQIVVSCYGHDSFGNDVIRGYGSMFLPTVSGRTERKIAIFVPEASTMMHKILGFFTGRRAEFVDPRLVSIAEGREVTQVRTEGSLTIGINTVLKGMKKFGYDTQPHTLSRPSEFPLSNFQDYATERRSSPPPQTSQQSYAQLGETIVEETTEVEPLTEERLETERSDEHQIVETVEEVQVIEEA